MWIFTFLIGVLTGGCGVAGLLWYLVLSFFFHDPDDKKRLDPDAAQALPPQPTSATFQLPPVFNP